MMGASGPNSAQTYATQQQIAKKVLESYDVSPSNVHVGVIRNGLYPKISLRLGQITDTNKLTNEISRITNPGDGNKLLQSLYLARTQLFDERNGARPGLPKKLIVFASSKSEANKESLKQAGNSLKKSGIEVVTIGVGQNVDPEELNAIVPDKFAFFFPPVLEELDYYLYPLIEAAKPGDL